MAPKAYSYLRFSTPEQERGDSKRRQSDAAEEYAARHGLELDRTLTFQDLGVSGFRGANAETGRLGDFLAAVGQGIVAHDSFLLVESLDRISRQAARKAIRVLEAIADAGVTVVTLNDGRAYTAENLNDDPVALLVALLTFIRANEESATKSRRLKAAWGAKRSNAGAKPLTSLCPSWLARDGDSFTVIPDRAAVVQRIFAMAAAGTGLHGIADALNRDKVPTFGRRGARAERWYRSYIAKIIRSPAVIGVLVPHTMDHTDGRRRRVPAAPVPDYFPAVVDEATFRSLEAQRIGGRAPGTRARAQQPVSILAGLARCPDCGGTMTRVNKGSGRKAGKPRLVCTRAKAHGCKGPSVVLENVERALLAGMDEVVADMPAGDADTDARAQWLEGQIEALDADMEELLDGLQRGQSRAMRGRLDRLEAERDAAVADLRALRELAAAAGGGMIALRAEELRSAALAHVPDRLQLNALMRRVFSGVTVDGREGMLVMHWHHGGISEVVFGWPRERDPQN